MILGVYGGFFSGGYVTLLTAAYVALFGMTFTEAVATTKVINIVSSGVATVIFAGQEIINYRLGVILGVTMFVGGLLGARITLRLPEVWLRCIFVTILLGLALKLLLYDFLQGLLL